MKMSLKQIVDASGAIERLCNSRSVDGDAAYELHKFYRRYREIMDDLGAFEKTIIEQIGLEIRPGGQLIFPGQDAKKLQAYLDRRQAFTTEKEIDITPPSYTYEQLKSVGMSAADIGALEDIGIIRDSDDEETPPETAE